MDYTDTDILRLLESRGPKETPSDVARKIGMKTHTMSTKTTRYRQRGILGKDNKAVDWVAFEEWERTQGKSKPAVYQESKPAVYSDTTQGNKTAPAVGKPQVYSESKPAVYSDTTQRNKTPPVVGKPQVYSESKPAVYLASKLESLLPKLEEIVAWWDKRKEALSKPSVYSTRRQTYILSEDLIQGIKEYAGQRGITITEAANELIRKGLAE